jgi:flavin reductase (DIM6/NTAB) family NADH-FMN oxidoreductase RutF
MKFDSMLQRQIMGRFATGVTVVTSRCGDQLWGMTANGILSLSLDPPLILVSIDRRNQMHACVTQGKCFAVNILTQEQRDVSQRFAARGYKNFDGIALTTAETGAPILEDALAYVDCRLVQILSGGDHDMFIGEILAGDVNVGEPLMFFGGAYAQLAPPPPAAVSYTQIRAHET